MTLSFNSIGHGPVVVLVHGTAPPMAWGALPQRLASSHRVITYGRRGYPPNQHLEFASSLRQHAEDLADILTDVGPGTVIGWSMGGVIGLDLALRRPRLFSQLVLVEAPLHAKRRPTFGQVRAVAGAQLKGRKDPLHGARHFLTWALERTDHRASDVTRLDEDGLREAAPAIVHELRQGTGEREISRAALAHLDVDTTWLTGTRSVPSIRRLAVRTARRSPRITTRRVAGAGHAIALDAPQAIEAAIRVREVSER